jgi:lipopolysaccharide/colanic/teichoic acid biosynthesis glycosyltransferase
MRTDSGDAVLGPALEAFLTDLASKAEAIVASPAKRIFDVLFAAAGLILSAPVWLLVAIAIKIDDGGPVFFRQSRSGLRGREFEVLKFRSMRVDAEAAGAKQAVGNDPRMTRVGAWMRARAIDELPQLWSILMGDMSVVGPRALRPGEIEARGSGVHERLEDVPGFQMRSLVRPGLTGVAQIYTGSNLPRRHKFRYDRRYIARQSFSLDLRLVLLSFWISLTGTWGKRGA